MSSATPQSQAASSTKRGQSGALSFVLKILISIFLVYHLLGILILPNSASFLGRHWGGAWIPYGNIFGFHTPWNLYSPDPASTMFIEVIVRKDAGGAGDEAEELHEFIPPDRDKMVFQSSRRRMLYMMRHFMIYPDQLESAFVPWKCRQHPGARSIGVIAHIWQAPTLDRAVVHQDQSIKELLTSRISQTFERSCPSGEESIPEGAQ